jgi:hypothetical protein
VAIGGPGRCPACADLFIMVRVGFSKKEEAHLCEQKRGSLFSVAPISVQTVYLTRMPWGRNAAIAHVQESGRKSN